jgi:transposase
MYIRQTTIKSKKNGEPYFTYRLVESNRIEGKVKQRTLLNLGRAFPIEREHWKDLLACIGSLLQPADVGLSIRFPEKIEAEAERIVAKLHERGYGDETIETKQYISVDPDSLEQHRPRKVGVEQLALHALEQLDFANKLKQCGFNQPQIAGAFGLIIGRLSSPSSERATYQWLQHESGLGELIGFDYEKMGIDRLYQVSDLLWKNKESLETHLFAQEKNLFSLDETVTLYDLTNTFFEGRMLTAEQAKRGFSKEKRSDCPLVTLGLVLDSSGFPQRSQHFSGNVGEASTLEEMLTALKVKPGSTIVMDAGIATEKNIQWLIEQKYRYLVVSRKRHREFDEEKACIVKEIKGQTVKAQKTIDEKTGEVLLYCHSQAREEKEKAMLEKTQAGFEEQLTSLHQGLSKKGTVKKIQRIQERIGRLRQKYQRLSAHYHIDVEEKEGKATAIIWNKISPEGSMATHPGVYCLRTNQTDWDETKLWHTYTMLTDLEAVFRSLKSELGMRPVYHQKQSRIDGHLFITLLAYHVAHTLRTQLKAKGLHYSWNSIRHLVGNRQRTTSVLQCRDGRSIHLRQISKIEAL